MIGGGTLTLEWQGLIADFRREVYGSHVRFLAAAMASAARRATRAEALKARVRLLYAELLEAPNLKPHRRAGMIARLLRREGFNCDVQHVRAILRTLGLTRRPTSPKTKAS